MYEYFYRVTSSSSTVPYETSKGFLASDRNTLTTLSPQTEQEWQETSERFEEHMDWSNDNPTPFISAYSNKERAEEEAERRLKEREDDVVLWTIKVTRSDRGVQWKRALDLEQELEAEIPGQALQNAECEVLFLNEIPRRCVVQGTRFRWRFGEIHFEDFEIER